MVLCRWIRTELKVEDILAQFVQDPHLSTRNAARRENMPSRSSIRRILKEAKFHPYRLQLCHQLCASDHQRRLAHANAQLALMENDPSFLGRLMFSDEAHFHVHGLVNRQDFRYWSPTNPGWYSERPLHSERVTVWAAIGRQGVIGPFFFQGNVTGVSYLALLQNQFLPAAQQLPNFAETIFMQDGAPPHWALTVRGWLTMTFPNRWMGRSSPNLPWPPNSPDLTPMDFFLWGWVKDRVYRSQMTNCNELRIRIEEAFQELPMAMVDRSVGSYERRLRRCVERNGQSVERLII